MVAPHITRRTRPKKPVQMFVPPPQTVAPVQPSVPAMFAGPLSDRGTDFVPGASSGATPATGFDWASLASGLGAGLLTGKNWGEGIGQGMVLANQFGAQKRQDAFNEQRMRREDERFGFEKQKYQTELDEAAAAKAEREKTGAALQGMFARALDTDPSNDIPGLTPDFAMFAQSLPVEQQIQFMAPMFQPKEADKGPSSVQEYEYAKQQGFTGSLLDYQTAKAAAGRQQTILSMPGNPTPDEIGAKAFAEANAKGQAEYWNSLAESGAQANIQLGDINQLSSLIEMTPQGAGQEFINQGAAFANRLGIDTSDLTNLPAAQAMQSIVARLAPTLRVPGSGAQSDFEVKMFLQSLPGITNLPQGNRIIANNMRKMAERKIQAAEIAIEVQSGNLTPSEGQKKLIGLGPLNLELPNISLKPAINTGGGPDDRGQQKRVKVDAQGNVIP